MQSFKPVEYCSGYSEMFCYFSDKGHNDAEICRIEKFYYKAGVGKTGEMGVACMPDLNARKPVAKFSKFMYGEIKLKMMAGHKSSFET